MTQKDIQKEAFNQAEKELLDERVKEVKDYILATLNKIEEKKKQRDKVSEELRILDLDLKDLRNGNFDKMKERQDKSVVSRNISVPITGKFYSMSSYTSATSSDLPWITYTSGTYNLNDGTIFYL